MAFAGSYFLERYGIEATGSAPPLREMLNQGIPVDAGSDATRVPATIHDTLPAGWSAERTQMARNSSTTTINCRERKHCDSTRLAAPGYRKKSVSNGRLVPGQYADYAMLRDDYFAVPEAEISSIESLVTFVGGRVVFGTVEYRHLAPAARASGPSWSTVTPIGGHRAMAD